MGSTTGQYLYIAEPNTVIQNCSLSSLLYKSEYYAQVMTYYKERTNIACSKSTRDRLSRLGFAGSSLESVLKDLISEKEKELSSLQQQQQPRQRQQPKTTAEVPSE